MPYIFNLNLLKKASISKLVALKQHGKLTLPLIFGFFVRYITKIHPNHTEKQHDIERNTAIKLSLNSL